MDNYATMLVVAGGIYHLFFGFFHMFFWHAKFLNWREELPRMSPVNCAVIQMLNVAVIIFMFLIAYISLAYSQELVRPGLGRTLLFGTVIFWVARLIGEFTLKNSAQVKPGLVVTLIIGILLYLLPTVLI
jgi:uncharacterized protein with PQ loop repeat